MGSSSSKPSGSRSASRFRRTKHRLSSLFLCGAPSSHTPIEFEYRPVNSPRLSVEDLPSPSYVSHNSIAESSTVLGSEAIGTRSKLETGTSSGHNNGMVEDSLIDYDEGQRCPSKNRESCSHQPPQGLVSANASVSMDEAADAQNSLNEDVSGYNKHSSSVEQERRNSYQDGTHFRDQGDIVVGHIGSQSVSVSDASDGLVGHQLPRNENPQVRTPASPGFPVSDTVQDLISENVLHVDVVSISSNILSSGTAEISNSEARRNSRRPFWDTFSRRSYRRHSDSPTILFASDDADDLGSHGRWHLNLSGDLHHDEVGHDSNNLGARTRHRNEGRWLGSEASERLLRALGEVDQQTGLCVSGRHPHGTCSCESFITVEEFTTLASISRIIMLAEALFEVLEELYRQPLSFSLSMPAPVSVVDSFPVKYHKRSGVTESESGQSDVQQCYICLADYEEGERLRILPCRHEYHVSCIDKWLKEINRVCPLCRRDICEDSGEGSASNTEVSSQ